MPYISDDLMRILSSLDFKGLGQIVFLILALMWTYHRCIKGSQAEQLLKGVFVVLLAMLGLWVAAGILNLPILQTVFLSSIFILLIGLIVIFQPELRRMLWMLGQNELFQFHEHHQSLGVHSPEQRKPEYLIQELCESVHFLSKSKRGALIVLESSRNPDHDYLEVGTALEAKLSTELLLTIFHPNTPLHDGAVIISSDNRIKAAGVLLPLTENPELSWQYGTRHRAAIGLTEVSGSRCLVVSEETGMISLVHGGKLTKLESTDDLKKTLERIYHVTLRSETKRSDKLSKKLSGIFGISSHLQNIFKSSDAKTGQPDKKTKKTASS